MIDSDIRVGTTTRYCGPFQQEWADILPHPPRVIFDVGAYDGGDTYRFKQWWPEARVISIEPHPALAARLRDEGLDVYELALGATTGSADFYYGDLDVSVPGPSGSLYRVKPETITALRGKRVYAAEPLRVEVSTLADLCVKLGVASIDILQIDAEGAEPDIVAGFGALRPAIVMGETGVFSMLSDCPHSKSTFAQQMDALGYGVIEEGEYDTVWFWEGRS